MAAHKIQIDEQVRRSMVRDISAVVIPTTKVVDDLLPEDESQNLVLNTKGDFLLG